MEKQSELALSAGRFLTFVKDNYPDLPVCGVDLSAFYLEHARDNMAYWASFTGPPRQ